MFRFSRKRKKQTNK